MTKKEISIYGNETISFAFIPTIRHGSSIVPLIIVINENNPLPNVANTFDLIIGPIEKIEIFKLLVKGLTINEALELYQDNDTKSLQMLAFLEDKFG